MIIISVVNSSSIFPYDFGDSKRFILGRRSSSTDSSANIFIYVTDSYPMINVIPTKNKKTISMPNYVFNFKVFVTFSSPLFFCSLKFTKWQRVNYQFCLVPLWWTLNFLSVSNFPSAADQLQCSITFSLLKFLRARNILNFMKSTTLLHAQSIISKHNINAHMTSYERRVTRCVELS